ncbi:MAG TPA: RluA family pseudouridine synthase [Flavipsychrobacter sp.]|nr:RluA family pseudouridine synthase [Flavipsychrobacter sp.]
MPEINDLEEEWDDLEEEAGSEDDAPKERFRITITKGQEPLRIDKYLMNIIEGATRNKIQQAIDNGYVTVNNQAVKANYKIKPGDEVIVIETRKAEVLDVLPEALPLDVVFEDDDILIINKKPGMVVHPGCGNYSGTLINGLMYYLQSKNVDTTLPRVGLVHRIDKNTSGLIVIAKTEQAMSDLAAQFKKHTVHRRYIALAWGDFEENEGTVEGNIGRNLRFRKIMDVFPEGDQGKHAITHFRVLERYNYVTLLELRLETGRTHQIRVHMKHIGHPLFNDETYGGDRIIKGTVFTKYRQFVENCFNILPRHALHAKELGFVHPRTKEWIQFSSELPADIQQVIEKWKSYTTGMTKQVKDKLRGD